MYISNKDITQEINFFQMVDLLEADKDEKRVKIDKEFYSYLNRNKNIFYDDLNKNEEDNGEVEITGKSLSFIKRLKALYKEECFTDTEISYLEKVEKAIRDGSIVRGKINQIYKRIDGKTPIEILNIIEDEISDNYLITTEDKGFNEVKRPETILSSFLLEDR